MRLSRLRRRTFWWATLGTWIVFFAVRETLAIERLPLVATAWAALALTNLWGSFFSRVNEGKAMTRPFRRGFFTRVGLVGGPPEAASAVTPEKLQQRVAGLLQV